MKSHWTHIELIENWTLSANEQFISNMKVSKIVYALKMKHYSLYGYLPEKIDEMPDIVALPDITIPDGQAVTKVGKVSKSIFTVPPNVQSQELSDT